MVTASLKELLFFPTDGARVDSLTDPRPADPEHFGFHMQALIGSDDSPLADSFDATICSPSWLTLMLQDDSWGSAWWGQPPESVRVPRLWIVRRWDLGEIDAAVRELCDECSPGPDWGTVADRIARTLPWEYDYRYDEHVNRRYGDPFPSRENA